MLESTNTPSIIPRTSFLRRQTDDEPENHLELLKRRSVELMDLSQTLDQPSTLTPQFVLSTAQEYFMSCVEHKSSPTMTGLALRLGTTRQELNTLEREDPLINKALTKARQIVTEYVERLLLTNKSSAVGLMFWLKNNDEWVDKHEVTQTRQSMGDFLKQLKKRENPDDPDSPITILPTP